MAQLIVEKGQNYIYKNEKWTAVSHNAVGYESLQHRIERYKFTIPETVSGEGSAPVIHAINLTFSFQGNGYAYGSGATGSPTFYAYVTNKEELPDWNTITGENSKRSLLDFSGYTETSKVITVTLPGGENIDGEYAPGSYYLYIYQESKTFCWWKWNSGNPPIGVSEDLSYTKCKPVQRLYSIQKYIPYNLTQPFALAWEASESLDGISNPAKGFILEWRKNESEPWNSKEINGIDNEHKKIELALESLNGSANYWTREDQIYFRIKTSGEATSETEDWDSDYVESEINPIINPEPVLELIKVKGANAEGIQSVYGKVPFEFYVKETSRQYYENTYEYYNNEAWQQLESNSIADLFEKTGEQEIKFRFNDGCEYSEEMGIMVYCVKPISFSAPEQQKTQIELTVTEDDTRDLPNQLIVSYGEITMIRSFATTEGTSRTFSFSLFELFKKKAIENDAIKLNGLSLILRNTECIGSENSSEVRPSYQINALETKFDATSFYSELKFTITDGMEILNVSIDKTSEGGTLEVFKEIFDPAKLNYTKDAEVLFKVKDDSSLINGAEGYISFIITYTAGATRKFNETITAKPRPDFGGNLPDFGNYTQLKAFEPDEETNIGISINNPLYNAEAKDAFNQFVLLSEGTGELNITVLESSTDSLLNFSINEKQFRDWIISSGIIIDYSHTHTIPIQIGCKNADDKSVPLYRSKSAEIKVNFEKSPQIDPNSVKCTPITQTNDTISWGYFQEGLGVKFQLTADFYSNQDTKILIELEQNSEKQTLRIDSDNFNSSTYWNNDTKEFVPNTGSEININSLVPLPELIAPNAKIYLTLQTGNDVPTEQVYELEPNNMVWHTPATYSIINGLVEDTTTRTIKITTSGDCGHSVVQSTGIELLIENTLYYGDEKTVTNNSKIFDFDIGEDTDSIYKSRILYKTTLSQKSNGDEHKTVKQAITNIFFIYANAPTVSYRQNCVGINITDPDSYKFEEDAQPNAALIISAASGRNRIYFIGDETDGFIDLSTGKIVGLTLGQDVIDKIAKITIDCGSWD